MNLRKMIIMPYWLGDLAVQYLIDLSVSAFRMGIIVLTPREKWKYGVFEYPLSTESDLEITIFANLITFSPGTMVVGLSDDKKVMFVHSMFIDEREQSIQFLKQRIERRVIQILRCV